MFATSATVTVDRAATAPAWSMARRNTTSATYAMDLVAIVVVCAVAMATRASIAAARRTARASTMPATSAAAMACRALKFRQVFFSKLSSLVAFDEAFAV
jgi:hypothetical protein